MSDESRYKMDFNIEIPLDDDGFIEMECDYCKNRFMLHQSVYSDEENLHFFCPICGLPNDINTFYCSEVLEAVQRKTMNYINEEIQRKFEPTIKRLNKNRLIKLSLDTPKRIPEKELYRPINEYAIYHQHCCDIDVKTLEFDNQIGIYCPICGGTTL